MRKKQIPFENPKAAVLYCRVAIRRVWLYCRVAHPDSDALEMQERKLREFAYQQRWSVEGISTDQYVGTTLCRPCLAELSKAVTDGRMDTVLVLNLCRLCRSSEDMTFYLNFLRKHGVDLCSVEDKENASLYIEINNALRKAYADSDLNFSRFGS